MRNELRYGSESWDSFWPESQLLLAAHHEEVDGESRAPFEVNASLCNALSEAGAMSITTVRLAPGLDLVGYCIWYLAPALDSPILCATQGPWFVLPEWRPSGAGIRVFKKSIEDLRKRGVRRAFPHHWSRGGGERLGAFFERLGAQRLEVSYSMWLDSEA